MTPDDYCRERASASGSSFYYSFLFLPPARRRAITALYAYCREVDDAVDETSDPTIAAAKLDWWAAEIERLYEGHPQHPVTQAIAPHIAHFGISRERMLQVLEGMCMDLAQTRFLDFAALARYCHLVAGVVGELAAGIFGESTDATRAYAGRLGLALQLVNILRDVGEDARRGRIYLPLDEMRLHGVTPADVLASRYVPGFSPLMHFQAQRARAAFAEAMALLPASQARAQRPGLIMAAIYANLLEEIEREDFRVLHQRIGLTPIRKLRVAWLTWVFGPPPSLRSKADRAATHIAQG